MFVRVVVFAAAAACFGQTFHEYAVVLEDAPLLERMASRKDLRTAAAESHLSRIRAAQAAVRTELASRSVRVTGAADTLVNAVFIRATGEQAARLRSLPGVRRVEFQPPIKMATARASELVNVPRAWTVIGNEGNAGAGMKIGIIDSGIDKDHPAFQDGSMTMPAGYPRGRPEDLPYTTNKIIVARSYVSQLPFPDILPADSRPDDNTPRDRVGHGTAVAAIAAGRRVRGPAAEAVGVAPKAYLGNYKVFGSPGVNDSTKAAVLIQALEDAVRDGMDVVTLSLGGRQAFYGPLDRCRDSQGRDEACDVRAEAVENAVRAGMQVVVSAGNDGDIGFSFPALNTIHTPGTAPSAITVGATTNSHIFFAGVRVTGDSVPGSLRRVNALFGNGPKPDPVLTAPLRDVSQLQDNGEACGALGNNTLTGTIALIRRGTCAFSDKVRNAQRAGAVGVVLYQSESNFLFPPVGLQETGIPLAFVGNGDGLALRDFVRTNPDRPVTLDPALEERDASFDTVAYFSSNGPGVGDSSRGEAPIKPELVAVGTDMYTATQVFDPNGDLFDRTGYAAPQGTSFAAPMVAGAVALVKQRNPGLCSVASTTDLRNCTGRLKSAVVNTANPNIKNDDGSSPVPVTSMGAGKLDVGLAVQPGATVVPSTISFGMVRGGQFPAPVRLTLTNVTSVQAQFAVTVVPRINDPRAQVRLSQSSVSLNAGQSASIDVSLSGSQPTAGSYEGVIQIRSGASINLRVPYLYLVGDGVADDMIGISGDGFVGAVNEQGWLMSFKLIDRFGAPVTNAPVRFRVVSGGGRIDLADERTDVYGIAAAQVDLGPQLGEQQFSAEAGGMTLDFFGRARLQPVIDSNGVVNAASFQAGPQAPGSYVSIGGRGLSETLRVASTPELPLSLAGVSVSFDAPSARLSLPGRLHFVSENQINLQIPWEFQGLNSVQLKVSLGPGAADASAVYTLPLGSYSPAAFEFNDAASGRRLIAALDLGFRLLTVANPARRRQAVQLYVNGLGPVDRTPASGAQSPADQLSTTTATPTVTIGGVEAQVLFSGLAPGIVGLYQVNVVVPAGAPTGLQPVVLTIGGVTSRASTLAVE